MAIHHAQPGELIDIRPLGPSLTTTPTKTLIKSKELEVIRLVLRKGKDIPSHSAPGEITVQCIDGRASFSAAGQSRVLTPGTMLYLSAGEPHSVHAEEDSSLLITILLH